MLRAAWPVPFLHHRRARGRTPDGPARYSRYEWRRFGAIRVEPWSL